MRSLHPWRLIASLLLAAVLLSVPALAGPRPITVADNGNHESRHEGSDDGNRGHGNDPDGADEDNPGNSSGPGSGRDDDDNTEKNNRGKQVETVPIAGYAVAVDCQPGAEPGTTACEIDATAPEGGRKVTFLQIPAEALCAGVIETDAALADPDPKTHVTGYASHGSDASLALVLDGEVTPSGLATYWVKAGGSVFPVDGLGLRCGAAADATPTATGTVVVETLTCANVPADTAGFDWFGACQPGGGPARDFTLTPGDGGAPPVTATTDETGEARFAEVAPGDYRLDLIDESWCHANADRVTADSEVVVVAGATSTVWIFTCDTGAGV